MTFGKIVGLALLATVLISLTWCRRAWQGDPYAKITYVVSLFFCLLIGVGDLLFASPWRWNGVAVLVWIGMVVLIVRASDRND